MGLVVACIVKMKVQLLVVITYIAIGHSRNHQWQEAMHLCLRMLKQLQELELRYEHAYTKPSLHNYANALWEEISHYIRAIGN